VTAGGGEARTGFYAQPELRISTTRGVWRPGGGNSTAPNHKRRRQLMPQSMLSTVADQLADKRRASPDGGHRSTQLRLTSSLRLQDGPLQGPKARRHRRAGRLPPASLRSRRVPWLGAHVSRGCLVEDSRTRHQRSTPCRCTTRRIGRLPPCAVARAARLTVGSRTARLAIMEGTARHGTRQGRPPRPSGISDA
jgi:hypothetical protein